MAYVDYTYYTTTYLGNAIDETSFLRLEMRARQIIDNLTFQRVAAVITADEDSALIDKIKMAVCAAAEEINKTEQNSENGSGVIQSERAGQHSVTYAVAKDATLTADQRYYNAVYLYLGATALMFEGFNADER
jgi:hypothetical protein